MIVAMMDLCVCVCAQVVRVRRGRANLGTTRTDMFTDRDRASQLWGSALPLHAAGQVCLSLEWSLAFERGSALIDKPFRCRRIGM